MNNGTSNIVTSIRPSQDCNTTILQYLDPLKEEVIENKIYTFSEITEKTSSKVRLQYEDNPYPRWSYTACSYENKQTVNSIINNEWCAIIEEK